MRKMDSDMDERLAMLEQRLDALRPLSDKQVSVLWAAWQNDDALFVFNTNAIEGSTLALAHPSVQRRQRAYRAPAHEFTSRR